MDFERIDINQCPLGEGNKGPNRFADTARCKSETTEVSTKCCHFQLSLLNYIHFSVNRWMDGVFEGEAINVAVNRNIDFRASFDNLFWVKYWRERATSNFITDLIVLKLDVSDGNAF